MTAIPLELDGARVLYVSAMDPSTSFGFVQMETGDLEIRALAICQYPHSPEFYLFACDQNWNVIGDLVYPSAEEAMQDAPRCYDVSPIEWSAVERGVA